MERFIKTVLITGGTRGLGRSLTYAFLKQGYSVAVNYLHSEKEARAIADEDGKRVLIVKADVGDTGQVREMIDRIGMSFGRLDVVINNAGITKDSLLIKQTEEEWDAILKTNLTGCFHTIRAAVPLMIRSGGGHIMNISSYSGVKGKTGQAAYSAAKAALIGLSLSAARELAEQNIRVNAVLPGYMMTDMGSKALKAAERAETESIMHSLSDTSDVARCIVSLSEMVYITGQIITLDSRII